MLTIGFQAPKRCKVSATARYRGPARRAGLAAGLLVAMLSLPTAAQATTYYVDGQNGVDTNSGSAAAPFRSLSRATSVLGPGDSLIVTSGSYTEPLIIAKSGTAQSPITVTGTDRPLIESQGDAIRVSGSYVEVSGFEAHALGEGSALSVGQRNHHVRITDNILRDSGCGGVALIRTDYVTIEHNTVFGNSRRSPWQCSGISIFQAVNFDHAAGVHNIIRRNLVYNNMDAVVDEKISHSNGKTTDGNGIIVDDSRHTEGGFNEPAYDGLTLVENNIVFDNGGRGITVFLSDHVIVRNNTCYHNLKDMNLAWRQVQGEFTAANASDVRFVNNIAVPLDKTVFGISNFQTTRITWDFNLVDGGARPMPVESETGWGQHNIVENGGVDFVAPSVDPKTADFHLRSGSRAQGAGSIDDAPVQDFSGALRPHSGPIDLGALQASGTGAAAIRN